MHRFFIGSLAIADDIEIDDQNLLWQWNRVLRLKPEDQIILFSSSKDQASYTLVSISKTSAALKKLENLKPHFPKKEIYLFCSLLKRDNNELVIQKCSELGVSNFVPVISARTIKKEFNIERAQKIAIEASEQCGRSDTPKIFEPMKLENAIKQYSNKLELFFAEKGKANSKPKTKNIGLFIGPEGGWHPDELNILESSAEGIDLGEFVLRSETAAIVGVSKLL